MAKPRAESLIAAALDVRSHAYAPYSGFQVGAALLTQSGSVYVGCNVENASYGLTSCAERGAIFTAIAHGERDYELIAVASPGGVSPCGACRQVLAEFSQQLKILLVDADNPTHTKELTIAELLPHRFDSGNLP
ncbi:MAG: cytidine deaminase [Planctomycetota bacterium]